MRDLSDFTRIPEPFMRPAHRLWAAVGSRHDQIIQIASIAFPIAAAIVGGLLLFAPLAVTHDISFMLGKNSVVVAKERMRLTRAQYRGQDSAGRPFELTAGSAVQKSAHDPQVVMQDLQATIGLHEGPATVHAAGGTYNLKTENIAMNGAIQVNTADGYHLTARDVTLNLKSRQLSTGAGVDGVLPVGSFSANSLHADIASQTVALDGHVHLHLIPHSGMKRLL